MLTLVFFFIIGIMLNPSLWGKGGFSECSALWFLSIKIYPSTFILSFLPSSSDHPLTSSWQHWGLILGTSYVPWLHDFSPFYFFMPLCWLQASNYSDIQPCNSVPDQLLPISEATWHGPLLWPDNFKSQSSFQLCWFLASLTSMAIRSLASSPQVLPED